MTLGKRKSRPEAHPASHLRKFEIRHSDTAIRSGHPPEPRVIPRIGSLIAMGVTRHRHTPSKLRFTRLQKHPPWPSVHFLPHGGRLLLCLVRPAACRLRKSSRLYICVSRTAGAWLPNGWFTRSTWQKLQPIYGYCAVICINAFRGPMTSPKQPGASMRFWISSAAGSPPANSPGSRTRAGLRRKFRQKIQKGTCARRHEFTCG